MRTCDRIAGQLNIKWSLIFTLHSSAVNASSNSFPHALQYHRSSFVSSSQYVAITQVQHALSTLLVKRTHVLFHISSHAVRLVL